MFWVHSACMTNSLLYTQNKSFVGVNINMNRRWTYVIQKSEGGAIVSEHNVDVEAGV